MTGIALAMAYAIGFAKAISLKNNINSDPELKPLLKGARDCARAC